MNTETNAGETGPRIPKIVVLDRAFVYVGNVTHSADSVTITDAKCVRRWGTSNGLGELASKGPQANTRLDHTGTVQAPRSALIHTIDCNPDAWAAVLAASA